jgi:hypothetical protein
VKRLLLRLASPAGFGLVLVLFFLMPFLSVSCDVPGVGTAGADYTGTHLIADDTPPWEAPDEVDDVLGKPDVRAPAGVSVLATALAVLAAAGVAAGLIPRLRTRRYGSAALAGATLVVAVVTMVVALANLRSVLLPQAGEIAKGTNTGPGTDPAALVDDVLHTEAGFWLVAVVLALIMLANLGGVFLSRRAAAASG